MSLNKDDIAESALIAVFCGWTEGNLRTSLSWSLFGGYGLAYVLGPRVQRDAKRNSGSWHWMICRWTDRTPPGTPWGMTKHSAATDSVNNSPVMFIRYISKLLNPNNRLTLFVSSIFFDLVTIHAAAKSCKKHPIKCCNKVLTYKLKSSCHSTPIVESSILHQLPNEWINNFETNFTLLCQHIAVYKVSSSDQITKDSDNCIKRTKL